MYEFTPFNKADNLQIQSFIQFPRELLTREEYKDLNPNAMLLYSVLIDRLDLSYKQICKKSNVQFYDAKGRMYVIFKREEIQEKLHLGRSAIDNAINSLKQCNLIQEIKQGKNMPNIIYLGKTIGMIENEKIGEALRKEVSMYPELAIREAVANSLVHQDFNISGTGPMVEIYSDRIEIPNPGIPLVKIDRFIDNPPKSRNEQLASFLRRIGVCEERGSGFDKIVHSTEVFQLPAPKIEVYEENTKVTLYAHLSYDEMSKEDKIRVCYMHACLKYVSNEHLSNASLRQRFGIEQNSVVSKLIKKALEDGKIKPYDKETAPRYMEYIPYWA